jgi:hypothetical protein
MTSLKTRLAAEGDAEDIAALVNAAFKVERHLAHLIGADAPREIHAG